MLRVHEIMTRDVVALSPDMTLRDAVVALTAHHISGAPVVSGSTVVGILSLSDLLAFQASTQPVPAAREVAPDWEEEPTPDEEDSLPASAFFTDYWDDAGADVSERFAEHDSPEWDLLGEHTVAEAMTRTLCTVGPNTEVPKAADYMRRAGIHRVLVMEHATLVGILSTMDIARAVADKRLFVRRYVFERAPKARQGHW
jgi:CBS domain-containing protein